jgi:transketolase
MRGQIIDAVFENMETNPDTFFLTADMGINLVEKIQQKFPDRFCNVGIAEQNLIGVSAGLSNLGYRPFTYTISNFNIHRCYEQIRNEIGINKHPITLLGTGTGYDHASLGPTHHIIDDWGALKNIPDIDIYCPSSIPAASEMVSKILSRNRPAYVRIPKGGFKLPDSSDDMVLLPGDGKGTLLISYGSLVQNCLAVQEQNSSVSVLVFNCLRPIDEETVAKIISDYSMVYVVEDHFPGTGLHNVLCQLIVGKSMSKKLISIAPSPKYDMEVGVSPDFFHRKFGLDIQGILEAIR